jgi:hypothetical protein
MSRTTFVIDSISEGIALLEPIEGGAVVRMPADWMPQSSREGDVVAVELSHADARSGLVITLDPQTRRQREASMRAIRNALPRAPEGDIEL